MDSGNHNDDSSAGKAKVVTGLKYGGCKRNHAVASGGRVLDGCCEFMPAGEEGTLDALICGACSCHRSFHRREDESDNSYPTPVRYVRPLAVRAPVSEGVREEGDGVLGSGRKWSKTKFTPEQKAKMLAFAEKVGWRMLKQDMAAVQQFCEEAGVEPNVLKTWLYNNKQTLGKKPSLDSGFN